MKIAILHPEFSNPGGIPNYFYTLREKFSYNIFYLTIGKRSGENKTKTFTRIINDYICFFQLLRKKHIDIVHINPSLEPKSLIRDGFFLLLAKVCKKKVLVFFHGWDKTLQHKIKGPSLWLFRKSYGKADSFAVLASDFNAALRDWGIQKPIHLVQTAVDDLLFINFDFFSTIANRMQQNTKNIIYLSRIIGAKGIYETIEATNLLLKKYPNIRLIIAGDGDDLPLVKQYIKKKNYNFITFTGYLRGLQKQKAFKESFIYCLPSSYPEGMPVSLLEAICFGLPVITRPVGGIADFFQNGEHGFITNSKDFKLYAEYIEALILDENLYYKISLNNYSYGKARFSASANVKILENIYKSIYHRPSEVKTGRGV